EAVAERVPPPIARSRKRNCSLRNKARATAAPSRLSRWPRKECAGAAACAIDDEADPFAKRRIEAFWAVGGSLPRTQPGPAAGGAIVDGPWLDGETGLAEDAVAGRNFRGAAREMAGKPGARAGYSGCGVAPVRAFPAPRWASRDRRGPM